LKSDQNLHDEVMRKSIVACFFLTHDV